MLHLITENKELKNRNFPIPDGVRKILQQTLKKYKGDKTIDGYKRLNNLLNMETISYQELKRIKNFFDHYNGSDKSAEFILNGGEPMKTWVNNTLYTATKAVHDFKQAKKDAGLNNAFIKQHTKDRQNHKKNKPTQVKFNTKNINKKMIDNNTMVYENIIKESIDIEDYYNEYGVNYVFNEFLSNPKGKQNWGTLINPHMYQKALEEFTKFGQFVRFPSNYVYQWLKIIIKNTTILEADTAICGHTSFLPTEEIEEFLYSYFGYERNISISRESEVKIEISLEEANNICDKNKYPIKEAIDSTGQTYLPWYSQEEVNKIEKIRNINKNGIIDKINFYNNNQNKKFINDKIIIENETKIYWVIDYYTLMDEIGIFDWMKMPDGSDAISDFGLQPLYKVINEYNDNMTPEQTLVIVNKALDVYHQRGDLSSIFIQGGTQALSQISNGGLIENKTIFITEQQSKMLKEAMDNSFSFEELTNLRSFNAKFKYCTQHLGKHIGKGSSRATFQIDDEKVLKLAWNEKGIAQNQEEERAYGDDIFPQIFDSADDGSWIISEFVLPAKKQDFKHCLNMSFEEFCSFIASCGAYRFNDQHLIWSSMPEEKWIKLLETNEDLYAFDDYIGNYGSIVVGDMMRICNWGLTQRNGQPTLVLLDSGFTEDVWNNYYKRR